MPAENHWFRRWWRRRVGQHSPANTPTAVPKQSPRNDGRANITYTRGRWTTRACDRKIPGRTSLRVSSPQCFPSVLFYVQSRFFRLSPSVLSKNFLFFFPKNPPLVFARLPPSVPRVQHSSRCTRRRRGRDAPLCCVRATGGVPGRPGGVSRFYPTKISVGPLFIIWYDTCVFQTRRPAGPNLNGFTGFEFGFNIIHALQHFWLSKTTCGAICFLHFQVWVFHFSFFFYSPVQLNTLKQHCYKLYPSP